MTLPQATITIANLAALIGIDEVDLAGTEVWFTPNITAGELLPLNGSLYKVEPIMGTIDEEGRLRDADDNFGVTILANDPSLNLANQLEWRVDFRNVTVNGFPKKVHSWWFRAPWAETTTDLSNLAHVPGTTATGTTTNFVISGEGGGGPVTAADIVDSGATGRSLIQAANTTAAWNTLGTVPSGKLPTLSATSISDSTSTGRSLLTAANAAAVRSVAGVNRNLGYYDVRDYGAVGDGTTDDTAAIQAAIDATAATKGGTVFFPPGRFKLTASLSLGTFERNWITLQGSGSGNMFISAGDDPSGVTTLMQTNSSANGITCYGTLGLLIRDMRVSGPKTGSGVGIKLDNNGSASFGVEIDNVLANYWGSHGISLNGICVSSFRNVMSMHNLDSGWNVNGTGNTYISCWGAGNKNHGWRINSHSYSSWDGCASDGNGLDGWNFSGPNCSLAITGSGSEYNGRDAFHLESDPEYAFLINFRNCSAVGNRHHGWAIRGRSTLVGVDDCWETEQAHFAVGSATGNGTATVLGLQPYLSTIAVGDLITLSGMTPSGYNGTWTVTAVSPNANQYTVNCTATGTVTVLGNAQPWKSVTAASGTGSTATITVPGDVHAVVNDSIFIDGVTPTGYNGTWKITALNKVGSNTQISFASTATGSVTVQGYARVLTKSVMTAAPAMARVGTIVGASPASYGGYRDVVWATDNGFPTFMAGDGGVNATYAWPRFSGTHSMALAPTAVKTSAYTAAVNDFVPVDATSAGVTVTLPNAPADGARVGVKKVDSSANAVTIARAGSDVFNAAGGATSLSLSAQNKSVQLQYSASPKIWYVVATSDM